MQLFVGVLFPLISIKNVPGFPDWFQFFDALLYSWSSIWLLERTSPISVAPLETDCSDAPIHRADGVSVSWLRCQCGIGKRANAGLVFQLPVLSSLDMCFVAYIGSCSTLHIDTRLCFLPSSLLPFPLLTETLGHVTPVSFLTECHTVSLQNETMNGLEKWEPTDVNLHHAWRTLNGTLQGQVCVCIETFYVFPSIISDYVFVQLIKLQQNILFLLSCGKFKGCEYFYKTLYGSY